MTVLQLRKIIHSRLSDDLLHPAFKKQRSQHLTAGHCYVASEVAYTLLGGKAQGWKPMQMRHRGTSHWFLQHSSGQIFDPTVEQFSITPDYSKARGRGFLTSQPSRRAQILIQRINPKGTISQ